MAPINEHIANNIAYNNLPIPLFREVKDFTILSSPYRSLHELHVGVIEISRGSEIIGEPVFTKEIPYPHAPEEVVGCPPPFRVLCVSLPNLLFYVFRQVLVEDRDSELDEILVHFFLFLVVFGFTVTVAAVDSVVLHGAL